MTSPSGNSEFCLSETQNMQVKQNSLGSFSMTTATAGLTPCKKINLYSTFEFRNSVNLFRTPIGLKICSGQTCTHSDHFQRKIPKISHWGSRSPKYTELGHFTLLFCRGRQRNVQRFKTHVHSYCFAH